MEGLGQGAEQNAHPRGGTPRPPEPDSTPAPAHPRTAAARVAGGQADTGRLRPRGPTGIAGHKHTANHTPAHGGKRGHSHHDWKTKGTAPPDGKCPREPEHQRETSRDSEQHRAPARLTGLLHAYAANARANPSSSYPEGAEGGGAGADSADRRPHDERINANAALARNQYKPEHKTRQRNGEKAHTHTTNKIKHILRRGFAQVRADRARTGRQAPPGGGSHSLCPENPTFSPQALQKLTDS